MVKKFLLISVLMIIGQTMANNPGLVTVVKREIIDKARDQYFESVFEALGAQAIPDVDAGDMKISQIKADISNASPENLVTSFHKDINAIGVELKETLLDVNVHWNYNKGILSFSGTARVKGTVQDLGMKIVMEEAKNEDFTIPQIKVQDMIVEMDNGKFDLDLTCSGCPGFVEDIIAGIMKGQLLDTVKDQVKSQVPEQANGMGNDILKEQYPTTFNLYDNIDLATALTQAIVVEDDHLEIHLDGTFFPHDQGYKRPSEPTEMPHFNPSDPGEIMMFFSSYLAETLSTTLGTERQSYPFKILGISYEASLDPNSGATKISFEDGDFVVEAFPKIIAPTFGFGLSIGGSVKLDPSISPGDSSNMMSVTPAIKEMTLSKLSIITPIKTFKLDIVSKYVNSVIKFMLNKLVIPKIAVPKQEVLPLHVTDSELDFHPDYSELGLLFEFN